MVEGQRLEDLSEESIFNITSFLIRPREQMRLHYSKALRIIQNKYKLKKSDVAFDYYGLGLSWSDNSVYKRYKVECRAGRLEKAMGLIKGQAGRIKSLLKSDGSTFMRIHAHYKNKKWTKEISGYYVRCVNT